MRKNRSLLYVLILALTAAMALSSCRKSSSAIAPGEKEKVIYFTIADQSEGIRLMMANETYFNAFTQNDLDYRMQKTNAALDEYKAFAEKQVRDFTDGQKATIHKVMDSIVQVITERGYQLPELEQIVFINTTMQEECGSTAYTHGTQIYINGDVLDQKSQEENGMQFLKYVFSHELSHCLTRCSSDYRSKVYKIIHFTTQEEDFAMPPSVKESFITNPDVERHNSYAAFVIDGKPIDCFAAFVTTKHFEKEGDRFFDYGTTALVPVDGSDRYYTPEETENFDEVFGTNTGYVIDPEECMADNFGYLIAYGMDGPDGSGYPNPEIITALEDVLTKQEGNRGS